MPVEGKLAATGVVFLLMAFLSGAIAMDSYGDEKWWLFSKASMATTCACFFAAIMLYIWRQ